MSDTEKKEAKTERREASAVERLVIHVDYFKEDKLIVASLKNERMIISAHGRTVGKAVKELGKALKMCKDEVHEYYQLPFGV